MGSSEDREHLERFSLTIYRVVWPEIDEILIGSTWGSRVGADEAGGASFVQRCSTPPTMITTGLVETPGCPSPGTLDHAASLRPLGLVSDRLLDTRYPEDYASYTRSDWERWVREVQREAEGLIADDARWTDVRVVVDDDPMPGVMTQVDDNFTAAAFYLPEGRLDIGIEQLETAGALLNFEQIRIARSTDLDQIKWDPKGQRASHMGDASARRS